MLSQEEKQTLHNTIFEIIRQVHKASRLSEKEKEHFSNEVRFLEEEMYKEEPNPMLVGNSLEDLKKSLPWLKDQVQALSANPRVRQLLKDQKKKGSWWKKSSGA